jgi:SPP1 family phage portal protein
VTQLSVNNFSPTIPIDYLINKKLESDSPIADGKVIKDLINKDVSSKEKKNMQDGVNYYNIKHDILNRTMIYYVNGAEVEDKTKSNYKIEYPYHRILVSQKVGYLVGKPIKFTTDDKLYLESLKEYLNDNFNDFICELTKNISNKGKEWLYIYINPQGKLDYQVIDAREVIPIYDTRTQKELISLIRYYTINVVDRNGKEKTRYKVEWYDKDKITYYIQDFQDNYILDDSEPINPQYYWYSYNTIILKK